MNKLDKRNIKDIMGLTPLQEGMLFHYLKNPGSSIYVEQLSLDISGRIDIPTFEKAWNFVVQSHEILRVVFRWDKMKHPLQVILKKHVLKPIYYDLRGLGHREKNKLLEEIKEKDRAKGFDLQQVCFRVTLCTLRENRYKMMVRHHHILYDGWSSGIVISSFFKAYDEIVHGRQPGKIVNTRFKEFVNWLQKQESGKQEKYWQQYLQGIEPGAALLFPLKGRQANPGKMTASLTYRVRFTNDLKNKLETGAGIHKITLAAVLYSAWGLLLQKYLNCDDVVFGTTVSTRPTHLKGIENTVGLFINTPPLRVQCGANEPLLELLNRVNRSLQERAPYEMTSLVDIKKYSKISPGAVLFNSIVVIENYPLEKRVMQQQGKKSNLTLHSYETVEQSHFDLALVITLLDDMELVFRYQPGFLDEQGAAHLSSHFINIVRSFIDELGTAVGQVEILTGEELKQILYYFNHPRTGYPGDQSIHEIFKRQAMHCPHQVALVFADGFLTYKELNHRAEGLAAYLYSIGLESEETVGMTAKHSLEMIIGILAILKAGGAYLPINPAYPVKRKQYLLEDSRSRILLTAGHERIGLEGIQCLDLNNPGLTTGEKEFSRPGTSNHLAYIIYTSGSTGEPKGVMVGHRNVVRLVKNTNYIKFKPGGRILATAALEFDASTFEIWGSLLNGLTLWMLEQNKLLAAGLLGECIGKYDISTMWLTAPLFNHILEVDIEIFKGLENLLVGGDVLSVAAINQLRARYPRLRVINGYGPTENTTFSTTFLIDREYEENIPIGVPIANSSAYVVDRYGKFQPIGVYGELWVSGDGVARGYLNNPELTFEKFDHDLWDYQDYHDEKKAKSLIKIYKLQITNYKQVIKRKLQITNTGKQNSTGKKSTNKKLLRGVQGGGFLEKSPPGRRRQKIYKTGDLVRWLPDGNLEFAGRMDRQVKIRGFRVELGEIERQLLKLDPIKEAVVAVKEDTAGDKYICAYIVGHIPQVSGSTSSISSPGKLNPGWLREYLSGRLPHYMMPAHFVQMEKIPLSPNGKVDWEALPKEEINGIENEYIGPGNKIEETLVRIWSDLLGIPADKIGINANFFELGGHSLKVTALVGRIHRELGVCPGIRDIFRNPILRQQAVLIGKSARLIYSSVMPTEEKEYYPATPAQTRMYMLNTREGIGTTYNISGALRIKGVADQDRLEQVFHRLVRRHENFRTSFMMNRGSLVQVIGRAVDFQVRCIDISEGSRESEVELKSIIERFVVPFDLGQSPLLRIGLVRLPGSEHLLLLDMHHIIADGVSMNILVREFGCLYDHQRLSSPRLQYKDYAQWLIKFLHWEGLKEGEKYWRLQLQGPLPVLNMPLDYKRGARQEFEGRTILFTMPGETSEVFHRFAREQEVTSNILFIAIYSLLLGLYSSQAEVIVGSLAAGRRHADLENIMGMFANFLPIRVKIDARHSFIEFLQTVKTTVVDAYENQDYPFDQILERLGIPMDLRRNPLFDTLVNFRNEGDKAGAIEAGGVTFSLQPLEHHTAKLDLLVDVFPAPQGQLTCLLEYNCRLFKAESIHRLVQHFNNLIHQVLDNPQEKLSRVELFTGLEKLIFSQKRERRIKLAVSATFTPELMSAHTIWWGRQFGMEIDIAFAPYNQVFQQLLDRSSLLATNPGVNLLMVRFEDFIRYLPLPAEQVCERLEAFFEEWAAVFTAAKKRVPYFVGIFPVSTHLSLSPEVVQCIENLNHRWKKIVETSDNTYVIDFTSLAQLYRIPRVFNGVMDRAGHMPFSREYYAAVGTWVSRTLNRLNHSFFKVIILDCEETLWQGTYDRAGAAGEATSIATPYRELQGFILQKHREGMVLVWCGKGDEQAVDHVFAKNPLMVLKREHFASWNINRDSRIKQIKALSRELDLPLHRFIFISSSRESSREVMIHCPEVLTLALPEQSREIPRYLKHVWAFDPPIFTSSHQHTTQANRPGLTLSAFLAGLELKISMNMIEPSQVPQAARLTREINQFNLSMIRRTAHELENLLKIDGAAGWVIEVSDRFGSYGLMGLIITIEKGSDLFIDTFLLNCRVWGRGVEEAMLVGLGQYCHTNHFNTLTANYYPFKENKASEEFLQRHFRIKQTYERYTTYTLASKDIPRKITYGQFYFQERFEYANKCELPGEPPGKPIERVKGGKSDKEGNGAGVVSGAAYGEIQREVVMENPGQLLHRSQLLPLEYPTGQALLDLPVQGAGEEVHPAAADNEPQNEIERELLEIWQDILKVKKIGRNTSFFNIGGNSLKAVLLSSRIHQVFGVRLSPAKISGSPLLRQMAVVIRETQRDAAIDIEAVEEKEFYPLSYQQQRLWFLNQLETRTSGFHIHRSLRLDHEVDPETIKKTIAVLMHCHESLRTGFKVVKGEPVQFILEEVEVPFKMADISGIGENRLQEEREWIYAGIISAPFDLMQPPLFRTVLVRWDSALYELMVNLHHLVTDGWSMEILKQDFFHFYEIIKGKEPVGSVHTGVRYRDFVQWHYRLLADEEKMQQAKEFWKNQLTRERECPVLDLPYDFPRKHLDSKRSKAYRLVIPLETKEGLEKIALQQQASLFMVLLAGVYLLLSHISGQNDIVLGTPGAAREHTDLENIMGLFVNTLILRNQVNPGELFTTFLERVRDNTLQALEYQSYPLELLCSEYKIRYPVISVFFNMLAFGNTHKENLENSTAHPLEPVQDAAVDMAVYLREYKNGLEITTHYYRELFKPITIERIMQLYWEILENISRDQGNKVEEYSLTGDETI